MQSTIARRTPGKGAQPGVPEPIAPARLPPAGVVTGGSFAGQLPNPFARVMGFSVTDAPQFPRTRFGTVEATSNEDGGNHPSQAAASWLSS